MIRSRFPSAPQPVCRVRPSSRFCGVAVVAALFFSVTMAPMSGADDPDAQKRSVDSALSQLREDLHDTEAGLAAAYLALRETEAKIPGAQAALTAAEGQLAAAQAADAQAAADLKLAQANEKKAEDQLAATSDQIVAGRGRVAAFAGQVYMEQGMGSLNAAVDADSPQQLADRLALVGAVMTRSTARCPSWPPPRRVRLPRRRTSPPCGATARMPRPRPRTR